MLKAKVKLKEALKINPTGARGEYVEGVEGDIIEIRADYVADIQDKCEVLSISDKGNYEDISVTADKERVADAVQVEDEDEDDTFGNEDKFDVTKAKRPELEEYATDTLGMTPAEVKKLKVEELRTAIKEKVEALANGEVEETSEEVELDAEILDAINEADIESLKVSMSFLSEEEIAKLEAKGEEAMRERLILEAKRQATEAPENKALEGAAENK